MTNASQILALLAALGYCAAFAAGLPTLFGRALPGRAAKLPGLFMTAAFLFQTAGMILRGVALGRCPIDGPADLLEVMSWSLVVMHAVVGTAFRMSALGFFTSGLAAILSVMAVVTDSAVSFGAVPSGVLVHAWLSLFSYGAYALLALTSAMYLLQFHGLRRHRWAGIFKLLPSLRELEIVNLRLLATGTLVFTVALALGGWWYFSGHPVGAGKLAMAGLAWAGYVAALAGRFSGALFGKKLAAAGVILFILALAALYPVMQNHVRQAAPSPSTTGEAAR